MKRKLFLLAAVACFCGGGGGGVANAQLFIHVYPSQDNPSTQTVWIFSGSSTAGSNGAIHTSGAVFQSRESWEIGDNNGDIFDANKPNDANFSLSPLLSSANTTDIASVRARIPGGGRTDITFAASATNTPTITIGSGSRTISQLFMDTGGTSVADAIGLRVSGSNLSYTSGNSSAWTGAGLINKPIGDFFTGTFNDSATSSPFFAAAGSGSVRVVVNSAVIPEPQEYALVFGLFALGFVIVRRHFQKKRQTAALHS